jgi:hypothetical protein
LRGKIDEDVPIRVSAPKIAGPHFLAAEENRGLVGERDPRGFHVRRGIALLALDDVGPGVLVRNDLGYGDKVRVAAAVIRMVVRIENVLHRLIRDGLQLRDDAS